MSDRIPCINPRCRRTASSDKHPDSAEIICGKCFCCLPASVRAEHRRLWRELRKWERRITRTADDLKANRMRRVRDRLEDNLNRHWISDVRPNFFEPGRPEGLASFLEEVGFGTN
ncbi:hypothetical protein GGQ99_004726 [Aminobacter niigataensis]|uniref:Uncharacterized protein n=1 Tax=Aminobacter niigataensis TaxID=83265 RepID=A0ABR6L812_9HYPH|nr:hypothetical protein [Aminobacter niigataensis]